MSATKARLKLTVLPQVWAAERPYDCADASKPCPAPGQCKHHLDNPAHPEVSCVLDVADDGPLSLHELGRVLGVSNEMVAKIQRRAFKKIAAGGLAAFKSEGLEPG